MELARELSSAEEALVTECHKTDELTVKLSKLSVRNVNRKLKRRDNKIQHFESEIAHLADENRMKSKHVNRLQNQVQSTTVASERHRVAKYRATKQVESVSDEKELRLEEHYRLKFCSLQF